LNYYAKLPRGGDPLPHHSRYGSPLSPLLYVFYNADLFEWKIDGNSGVLGFVDDLNAWVVGDDVKQNTKAYQDTIMPHAEH
jgi:hypothetical protein